jgi:hypothetical protein
MGHESQARESSCEDVLKSLTLYVDGDGFCFVGIEQLGFDCELSPDTMRRRLVWLEEIGAIARRSQWIDASCVRNGEGRGKRTSDPIRLLVDADQDAIEARARGEIGKDSDVETTAFSPSSQPGLNAEAETISPLPALCQPSHCGEGLISEPEPESPPLPPPGGGCRTDRGKRTGGFPAGLVLLAWSRDQAARSRARRIPEAVERQAAALQGRDPDVQHDEGQTR